jgi:hypothetical protein
VFLKVGSDMPHWPVGLLIGIVLWNFFSEITSAGVGAIVGRGDVIRKINFPKYIIVLSSSISALINLGLNLIVISIFMALNGVDLHWSMLISPIYMIEIFVFGLDRGDAVSCSGGYVPDSVKGFYHGLTEAAILSQRGYGTSGYLGDIRPRGTPISKGGKASGVVPVFEDFNIMSNKISQGNTRRGQWAGYLPIMHGDFYELWDHIFKNPTTSNIGWTLSQVDIDALNRNDPELIRRFNLIQYLRSRHGKGYIYKPDTANNLAPQAIKNCGIPIVASNLCGVKMIHSRRGCR